MNVGIFAGSSRFILFRNENNKKNNEGIPMLTMSHEAVACRWFDTPDPTHVLLQSYRQSGTVFHDAWRKCVIA